MASSFAQHWTLDPNIDFLNHGSFGACPSVVLEAQARIRAQLEREPVRFMIRELEGLLDDARASVARLVRADPDDLAFVPNSTTGVNTVLRSLALAPEDELVTTNHTYGACRNALDVVAERAGARVVTAAVPFPGYSADEARQSVLACVTPRTRLVLLDHVTSPTAVVFPVAQLVAELAQRGIDTLVDGAHAPGMLQLDLTSLGAAYYTANCHKWLCAPKGAAFLYVRRDRQARIRPLVISHGASSLRRDRSRFRLEFDWTGTADPSPFLAVPAAIAFLEQLLPGGLPALLAHNRALALRARDVLCDALVCPAPSADDVLGSMITLPLPPARTVSTPNTTAGIDPLQDALYEHGFELPVFGWPTRERRFLRVTAQAYNSLQQYERLAQVLRSLLARGG